MIPENWRDIRYLITGSEPQQLAYRLVERYQLLAQLSAYDPVLAGTFPLDITVPGSDLDILCHVHDFDAFLLVTRAFFAQHPSYAVLQEEVGGEPSVLVSFALEGTEVEVFGQRLATDQQIGFRHLAVEAKLLAVGGPTLKQQVLALKQQGLKTEPAFAQLLGLTGDPYRALLALETFNAKQLAELIASRSA